MKILFCDNSLRNLLNFRGDVIDYFMSKGHKIIIAAPKDCEEESNDSKIIMPIEIERCGMNPIADIKYFYNIYRLYKKSKPDYIFHYTIKPNIYGSIAAKILNIPSTAMVTGMGYAFNHNDFRSKVAKFLYKIALGFNENIMVLNAGNKEKLIDMGIIQPDKIILLEGGEGVNLKKFS